MSGIVTITAPAPTPALVELVDLKEELGITDNSEDSRLSRYIADESARITSYTGKVFRQQTMSEQFWTDTGGWYSGGAVMLSGNPVVSITSVTEDTNAALVSTDYEIDGARGLLYRLGTSGRTSWAASKLVVVYVAGYAVVPADISAACMALIKHRRSTQARDPALRSITIEGVGQKQFWVGPTGEGSSDVPYEVEATLNRYVSRWL